MHVAAVTASHSLTELPGGILHVHTDQELGRLIERLRGDRLLALDTEAASFHRYQDRVYLIQISSRSITAVVDPLSVGDLSPIGGFLADPKIEVILHDADYDLRLLDKDLGFRARTIFDTRIASQFLGEPGIGLAALLEKYFQVTLDKRFQRADWSSRPLSSAMLAYAATDTRHLPDLRDALHEQLSARGRLAWAEEEFSLLESVRWAPREPDGDAYLRIKGARKLAPRSLAILRELHRWREGMAKRRDKAAFRILNNQPLLEIAKAPPANENDLEKMPGISREGVRRHGTAIMAAVERGRRLPDEDLPKLKRASRPKVDPDHGERLDRLKAARNAVAQRLELDPGVVCPNGTLEAVASRSPQTLEELIEVEGVRQWQVGEFGPELVAAITPGGD
jgi:ribonuclease D